MTGGACKRIVGTVIACATSLSVAGALPILAHDDPGCCCRHHSPDCDCRACTHARELASGQTLFETCSPRSPTAVLVTYQVVVVTAVAQLPQPAPLTRVDWAPCRPPPNPVPEVPTPPPLARS